MRTNSELDHYLSFQIIIATCTTLADEQTFHVSVNQRFHFLSSARLLDPGMLYREEYVRHEYCATAEEPHVISWPFCDCSIVTKTTSKCAPHLRPM